VNGPADPTDRDLAAIALVHDLQATTQEVLALWPVPHEHPAMRHLGELVDEHGLFTILTVALGHAGHHVRHLLRVACGTPVDLSRYCLTYPAAALSRDLAGVVTKLLEHTMRGEAGVVALYDACQMLRLDGAETGRVLLATLDLCAALRDHRVSVSRLA
jgi:hypothetical protein